MNSVMFLLFLALSNVLSSAAVSHTLKYFLTEASGVPNFPEFVGVAAVDDVQILHYDGKTRRAEPKQEWMKKVTADDRSTQTAQFLFNHQSLKAWFDTLKQRLNQTGGVHVYQRMFGCQWDDETGETDGFDQHGYDGEDFMSFKLKEKIYVAAKQQAEISKDEMNQDKFRIEDQKNYLTYECIYWLKRFVDYGRSFLMRTDLPSVSLLQKSPSSPVCCHATGFYPDAATLSWRKGEEELHEEVEQGEILPNPDGSFQMSADLDLSSVPPEGWSSYNCVFQLSGGKEILTRLDRNRIRSNWEENPAENPSNKVVIAVAVVVLVRVIIAGVIIVRNKRGKCTTAEGHSGVTEALKSIWNDFIRPEQQQQPRGNVTEPLTSSSGS